MVFGRREENQRKRNATHRNAKEWPACIAAVGAAQQSAPKTGNQVKKQRNKKKRPRSCFFQSRDVCVICFVLGRFVSLPSIAVTPLDYPQLKSQSGLAWLLLLLEMKARIGRLKTSSVRPPLSEIEGAKWKDTRRAFDRTHARKQNTHKKTCQVPSVNRARPDQNTTHTD